MSSWNRVLCIPCKWICFLVEKSWCSLYCAKMYCYVLILVLFVSYWSSYLSFLWSTDSHCRGSLDDLFDLAKLLYLMNSFTFQNEKRSISIFFTIIKISKENKAEYFCQMGVGYSHVFSNDTFLTVKVNIYLFWTSFLN